MSVTKPGNITSLTGQDAVFKLNTMMDILFGAANRAQEARVRSTVPAVAELREGEIAPYDDTTHRRLYVRLNNALYYVTLTAV